VDLDATKNQYAVVRPSRWLAKDEAPFHMSSDFRTMSTFVSDHALSRVAPYSSFARRKYKEAGMATVSLFFDQQKLGKMFKYIVNRIHKLVAEEPVLTNRFAFTVMDLKHARMLPLEFGIPAADFAVTVTNLTSLHIWGSDVLTNMTAESFSALPLTSVLRRISNGEEPPYVKTEPEPAEPARPGQVENVVATNFAQRVDDEAIDVLLAIYTTEAPTALVELAMLFHKLPTVRILQMNGTANAYNYSRFGPRQKTDIFVLPASAAGKLSPIRDSSKAEARSTDLASLVLKHIQSAADVSSVAEVKQLLRRGVDAEKAQGPFADLPGGGEKKSKKKKKKKRASSGAKGGSKKDEL